MIAYVYMNMYIYICICTYVCTIWWSRNGLGKCVYIYISCMIIRVYIYNIHCTKDEIEWIGRVRFSV